MYILWLKHEWIFPLQLSLATIRVFDMLAIHRIGTSSMYCLHRSDDHFLILEYLPTYIYLCYNPSSSSRPKSNFALVYFTIYLATVSKKTVNRRRAARSLEMKFFKRVTPSRKKTINLQKINNCGYLLLSVSLRLLKKYRWFFVSSNKTNTLVLTLIFISYCIEARCCARWIRGCVVIRVLLESLVRLVLKFSKMGIFYRSGIRVLDW